MIILPDRYEPRGKILMPMRRQEWMRPSARRATFGIEDSTHWEIRARTSDGQLYWKGLLWSREDADQFMWAIQTGELVKDRYVQRLIDTRWTREWDPALAELPLIYECVTNRNLTSTSASNQTDTVPSDWNSSSNFIATIGAGGGGKKGDVFPGAPGGGGAYSAITNLSLTPGGSATYRVEAGGTAGTGARPNGGDTWYNGTTLAGSSVGAKGATGVTSTGTAGVGGASASGVGTTKVSGGNGGANNGVGGAGGAGGPNGAGKNGGAGASIGGAAGGGGGNGGGTAGSQGNNPSGCCCCVPGAGGAGGNNSLGSGGGSSASAGTNGGGGGGGPENTVGGAGGAGNEWTTHGSGGGAGGTGDGASGTARAAGLYGAGGAGIYSGGTAASAGGQGIIHIEYTAASGIPAKLIQKNYTITRALYH